MTPFLRPGPDLAVWLRRFLRLGPLARRIVFNWCHTQGLSITEQLCIGIRYFDLRLCFDAKSNSFWLTHALLACPFRDVLHELESFISTHPGEVVLLDFNHFYTMDPQHHEAATDLIVSAFKPWLCPPPQGRGLPSLKECEEKGYRVIVFYHAPKELKSSMFWGGSFIPSPWPNVIKKTQLFAFLESQYKAGREDDLFYVTQGVLTPTHGFIALHLWKNLRNLADEVNPKFVEWLADKKAGPQGINVCIVDFVAKSSYVQAVIDLNYRSSEA